MKKVSPNLVISDNKGKIYIHPSLKMLGSSNNIARLPAREEIVPIPLGSTLFYMPGHVPIGYDVENGCEALLTKYGGKEVFSVSAFLIPGYTRLLLPAAKKINEPSGSFYIRGAHSERALASEESHRILHFVQDQGSQRHKENTPTPEINKNSNLPLWSYTAVGWAQGRYWVSAIKIDPLSRQRPHYYGDRKLLGNNINSTLKRYPANRLFLHLSNCAINYNCRAAQNLFFRRWEAPLPISPSCNARCIGCLSLQDSDCTTASHSRIKFVPTPEEIAEVAVSHIKKVREAIVSFGQGCEGEPLLQFKTLKQSINKIRQQTSRGTIHLNTNAYKLQYLRELSRVGLNSVRISINSFQEKFYNAYYRPKGYKFNDVLSSIKTAKKVGLFVSLNLLVFPGLTDTPTEVKRLIRSLKMGYVDLLQLRNLCIDSDFYLKKMPKIREKALGVGKMIKLIKKSAPRIRFGYFNLPKERF